MTSGLGDSNYWARPTGRRRMIGGGLALTGAAALAAACGGSSNNTAATKAAVSATTASTTASGTAAARAASGTAAATRAATAAAGGSPAAAASQAVDGGILQSIWLGGSQFDSVDVHRNFRDETSWLSNYILNKVVRYSNPDKGTLEGDLADKWETPDSQTYTFSVRKDVKWQDTPLTKGRAFTAEDIKWHIERQQAGKLVNGTAVPFRQQSVYEGITVETPDANTVKLTLPSPNGAFLFRLASYFSTVPNREATEKFEGSNTTLTEEAMPATGAYTLRQWQANKDVQVKKNPLNFRKGEPHFDGMILPVGLFADPTAARLAFEQKQIDAWAAPDASLTKAILDAHKDSMYEVLTGVANTVYLNLNMNQQFKDIRLVKAMNMAIDRRLMIQTFHQGLGQVSGPVTWLQEGFAMKPEDLVKQPGYRADRAVEIKEARDLWAAGGGPALGDVDIRVIDIWSANWPDTSQVLVKMFNEALGVNQIKSTKGTYNDDVIPNLSNGTFVNWMAWTSQVNSPDPRADLRAAFHSKSTTNFQKVNNPQLDKLLDDALQTADLTKAASLTLDAQKILLDNAQYGNIVLYNYISRSASWNYYHGNLKTAPAAGKAGVGWNIFAGHLSPQLSYLDSKDPSYADAVKNRTLI